MTAVEVDLVAWIIGMQSQGYPVSRDMILVKANMLYQEMYGSTRSSGYLKKGWLNRFMDCHPTSTTQTSQVIKRVQSEAMEEGLLIFTWEFAKHVIEKQLMDDRIFNMDETGFAQKNKSKKFIAVTGWRWFELKF